MKGSLYYTVKNQTLKFPDYFVTFLVVIHNISFLWQKPLAEWSLILFLVKSPVVNLFLIIQIEQMDFNPHAFPKELDSGLDPFFSHYSWVSRVWFYYEEEICVQETGFLAKNWCHSFCFGATLSGVSNYVAW
jgi:hypothetical protein